MLSPLDLKNKKVEVKKKKYYDKEEMDQYLELVFDNYKELYNANQELEKNVKTLSDGIQYYRSIESTMQKALVLAEKTAKETKDAAQLKAEAIEKDATAKAEMIIDEAEQEYEKLKERCLHLVQQFNQYKLQLQQVASAQLELITSDSFDVYSPEIEAIQNEKQSLPQKNIPTNPMVEDTIVPEKPVETTAEVMDELFIGDEEDSLEKTMVIPDVKKELANKEAEFDPETNADILTADTIDLSASLKEVQAKQNSRSLQEPTVASPKKVQDAMVLEPVDAVVTEPLNLEPSKEEDQKEAPTLDSLLQSINIGKKNKKQKGQDEDPFEFLGSVDDF